MRSNAIMFIYSLGNCVIKTIECSCESFSAHVFSSFRHKIRMFYPTTSINIAPLDLKSDICKTIGSQNKKYLVTQNEENSLGI